MRRRLLSCLPPLLLLGAASAAAFDQAQIQPLWIGTVAAPQGLVFPFPLALPPGWASGDAAVVLLRRDADQDEATALRAALLEDGAAVLELDPRAAPAVLLVAAALEALRANQGAGLVVAIGFGALGEAALGARAHAGIALTRGEARFRAGPAPPPTEEWPMRAWLLCDLLARQALAERGACRAALR